MCAGPANIGDEDENHRGRPLLLLQVIQMLSLAESGFCLNENTKGIEGIWSVSKYRKTVTVGFFCFPIKHSTHTGQ
jgi:hypothetical protein